MLLSPGHSHSVVSSHNGVGVCLIALLHLCRYRVELDMRTRLNGKVLGIKIHFF
jgi:hypothetical protein